MSVVMRQEVERKIAKAAIKQLLADGYALGVFNGETVTIHHSRNAKAIEKEMFTTDEDHLFVYSKDDNDEIVTPRAWVKFVYGNSGYDVICDYTRKLEPSLTEAQKISDHYAD